MDGGTCGLGIRCIFDLCPHSVDVTVWYPNKAGKPAVAADEWTYDKQIRIAELCDRAGYPFGFGCGSVGGDSNQTWGTTFGAFGANLVDASGVITVDTDNVRAVMDYCKRFVQFLPKDTADFDDASNNRLLISGKSPLIQNPPSAWFVAKRDAPEVAADCWTFPGPRGKMGRLVPYSQNFLGVWDFAQHKEAAKDLISWLSQREQTERLITATNGYDLPPFPSMSNFKIWEEIDPPKGTIYNYPVRPWHDAAYYIAGSSAPPDIAMMIWNRFVIPGMVARLFRGGTIRAVMDWAKSEIEGMPAPKRPVRGR